ncbi:MAG: hypothetical protein WAV20_08060 [Blastocatellia bacterium]
MIKKVKLFAALSIVVICVALQFQTAARGEQDQSARLFEIAGMNVTLEERIGVDDGAAFAVHFVGDTRGNLDTCG